MFSSRGRGEIRKFSPSPPKNYDQGKNARKIDPKVCLDDCIFVSKKCCDMISSTPLVKKEKNIGRSNLGNPSAAATGKQKDHKPTLFPNGSSVFRIQSTAAAGQQKHHKPTLFPNGSCVFPSPWAAAARQQKHHKSTPFPNGSFVFHSLWAAAAVKIKKSRHSPPKNYDQAKICARYRPSKSRST